MTMSEIISTEKVFRLYAVISIFIITGVCAECDTRSYINSVRCVKCPTHCRYCNSTGSCHLCDVGYSGATCAQPCTECKANTRCTKDDGFCEVACKDGLSGPYCNKTCDRICNSCFRNDTSKCLTYKNNQTFVHICPDDCLSQMCEENICNNECLPGYWGVTCKLRCPENCKAGFDGPTLAGIHSASIPVMAVLLVTLLGVLLSLLLWKRRLSRQRDARVVMYTPKQITRRPMEAERISGTPEEIVATSRTTEVQDNVTQFSSNKDPFNFSPVCENADLLNQHCSTTVAICTTFSGTDNSERQQKLTSKTVNTTDATREIREEHALDPETHVSNTVSAYITPIV